MASNLNVGKVFATLICESRRHMAPDCDYFKINLDRLTGLHGEINAQRWRFLEKALDFYDQIELAIAAHSRGNAGLHLLVSHTFTHAL